MSKYNPEVPTEYGKKINRLQVLLSLWIPSGDVFPTVDEAEDGITGLFYKNGSGLYVYAAGTWTLVVSGGTGGTYEPIITADGNSAHFWNGNKSFIAINSDIVVEGSTNKFYADSRSRGAVNVAINPNLTYNSATGTFTLSLPVSSPITFDAVTGTFGIDLSVLDQRYSAIPPGENAMWNAKWLQSFLITSDPPQQGDILTFDATLSTWILSNNWAPVLEEYANNTAAVASGLAVGKLYKLPYDAGTDTQLIAVVK